VGTDRLDNYIVRYISYDIHMRTDWNQYSGGAHFTHTCHPGWRHVAKWRMRYAKRRFAQAFSDFMENFRDEIRDFMGRSHEEHRGWGPWEDWGPFSQFAGGPRGGRFFGFGEARLAILSLLKEGPKHGYQLIKELEQRSGGLYRASAGTVYPTLQQLEDEKLLRSAEQDGRKLYTLTEEGLQEIEREKEAIDRIWRRAERWGDWGRWSGPESFGFFRPLAAMVKATFRAAKWAAGDSQREERLLSVLEKTIQQLDDLRKE
jgi:DNA-binding PadR family transcriptional regulator